MNKTKYYHINKEQKYMQYFIWNNILLMIDNNDQTKIFFSRDKIK